MATLHEIQQEELKMLSYLDTICQRHGLKYSMIGGTMLGAVRHQGFIPWDDDIDIYMPITDLFKLEFYFMSDKYFLQTPKTDIEAPFIMYKIRKLDSYMQEPGMECLNINQGIWLDIFGYTDAGKTDFMKKCQHFVLKILRSYRCRYLHAKRKKRKMMHILLSKLPLSISLSIDRLLLRIICLLGNKESNQYFALDVGKYLFFEKRYFDQQKLYIFEEKLFCGIEDADSYLSYVYGKDYMTPRKWGHIQDYSGVIIGKKE